MSLLLNKGLVAVLAVLASIVAATSPLSRDIHQHPQHPNIVLFLADNLGAQDVASGPSSFRTPHIASLARDGMNLSNWNSAAHLCSASRAALLTGKYPIRTGVYPGVFKPDAVNGLLPNETTLAEHLKARGYATAIIGKWHLGHRKDFLPTNQGFDEWLGIPYHMSGGSLDNHTCNYDTNATMWLPLYQNEAIIQQPVNLQALGDKYAQHAGDFIRRSVQQSNHHRHHRPFFLYMAFSHVHQLCAPRDYPEQSTCQWAGHHGRPGQAVPPHSSSNFHDAVAEMDWITGEILKAVDETGVRENTLIIFTSDNGPWVAEQSCSGEKGPFKGQWLIENVSPSCTACPHDYVSKPTVDEPHRCVLPGTTWTLQGVPCGEDSGLGSMWESNLRMPALVRWPSRIAAHTESNVLVSTLDVVPTLLSITGSSASELQELDLDGVDISSVWFGSPEVAGSLVEADDPRVLFFWRDGFGSGPLPPPYGRFDVVAIKVGRIKAWFWTKSAHYNADLEVYHDPPLLFDTLTDPAEAQSLDPSLHWDWIRYVQRARMEHLRRMGVNGTGPLTLARDPKYLPCANRATGCRIDSSHRDAPATAEE